MKSIIVLEEALAGALTNEQLDAVTDQLFPQITASLRYILPRPMKPSWVVCGGTGVTGARFNAPSLRNLFLPAIYPVNVATPMNQTRAFVHHLGPYAPFIQANEEFTVELSHTGAGPDQAYAVVALDDGLNNRPPTGPRFKALATATQTLVAQAWTFSNLTFDQVLPSGRYEVYGIQVICNDAIAARLVFPGQNNYRPGTIAFETFGQDFSVALTADDAGEFMGEFFNTATPGLEIFGDTAGAETATVFLDLVKVGSNPGFGGPVNFRA